jgi:hypothetical protein
MWVRQTQSIQLGLNLALPDNFEISKNFEIISQFVVPGLGFEFTVGVVSFSIGLTALMDGGVTFATPNGLSLELGYSASRTQKMGFSFDGSTSRSINEMSPLVTSTTLQHGQLSAELGLHLYPELDFGLAGSFLGVDQSFQLAVSILLSLSHVFSTRYNCS